MPKFTVEETQTVVRYLYFNVEAESAEKAIELVEAGTVTPEEDQIEEDITQSQTRVMDE